MRWEAAAERDLRRLLHYTGPVRRVMAEHAPPSIAAAELDNDVERRWLERELARLARPTLAVEARVRAFRALCRRWERATRRARWAAVP